MRYPHYRSKRFRQRYDWLGMPESIYKTVADKATWSELDAISAKNYVEVPAGPHNWMGMPPSVQRYLGMIWLTAVLYPEYCDYDVNFYITPENTDILTKEVMKYLEFIHKP